MPEALLIMGRIRAEIRKNDFLRPVEGSVNLFDEKRKGPLWNRGPLAPKCA